MIATTPKPVYTRTHSTNRAYTVIYDGAQGYTQGRLIYLAEIDPHKARFPERAGIDCLSCLTKGLLEEFAHSGITLMSLPSHKQKWSEGVVATGSSLILSYTDCVSNRTEIDIVNPSIYGTNGSTRARISINAGPKHFWKMRKVVEDYLETI
jgi:hypothetical protein